MRNLLRRLAGEGRTVFVSSHLMSEMAQTADHLIVIGRGKLIADTSVADFVARASKDIVHVRSPQGTELAELVTAIGGTVIAHDDGLLEARGVTPAQVGELAAEHRIVLHELSPQLASLEEAFMDITKGELESRRGGSPVTSAALEAPRGVRVTQLRVIRSEWTKLWTLKSTAWSLLVAVVLTIGFPVLAATVISTHWGQRSPGDRAHFNPLDPALVGSQIAQLAIGVLGVLVISGEYSTGMIRSSLAAVPKRLPVLWAKAAVFGVVTFALMLPAVLVAFFASQSILRRTTRASRGTIPASPVR